MMPQARRRVFGPGRYHEAGDSIEHVVVALAAFLIGVSKAGFGGGTGILVAPLLALYFPAKTAVSLMLPLLFACDIVSLYFYWRKWDHRNVALLTPGAMLGIVLGSYTLEQISDTLLAQIIGVISIAFAALQVLRGRWAERPLKPSLWLGFLAGLGTGYVSTLAHVGGVLTTMYLLLQGLDSRRFVATTTAVYFFVNLAKVGAFSFLGLLNAGVLLYDLPFIPAVFAGTVLGVYLNQRVSGVWFGRIVLAFVLITGFVLLFSK
jgi:uncharacterized protein